MAVFNASKREIDIKIVYYGPALCGKTTNVQSIHKHLNPAQRGEIVSLATKDDRTLFFDFLPIELGSVRGFKTRFHVYTVPGQVYYALTRRAVLTAVDGVVFVADSQKNKLEENRESLQDLAENLKFYKKDISSIPFIFQYNKRDLPDLSSVNELDELLNTLDAPCFEASAIHNKGVMETLTACCKLILKQMDESAEKKEAPGRTDGAYTADTTLIQLPSSAPQQDDLSLDEPELKISSEERPPLPLEEPSLPFQRDEAGKISEKLASAASACGPPESQKQTAMDARELGPGIQEPCMGPEEQASRLKLETEDISQMPASERPASLDEQPDKVSASTVATPSLAISGEPGTNLKIIACGQPQKDADSSIKIPLIFRIEPLDQECMLTITLKFDDFILREK